MRPLRTSRQERQLGNMQNTPPRKQLWVSRRIMLRLVLFASMLRQDFWSDIKNNSIPNIPRTIKISFKIRERVDWGYTRTMTMSKFVLYNFPPE